MSRTLRQFSIAYSYHISSWSSFSATFFFQGSMKIARTAVSAASHNGVLYAVGGECAQGLIRDDTVYLRSLEAYNPIMKVCFVSVVTGSLPLSGM